MPLLNDSSRQLGFDTPMETTKLDELNLIQFPSVATVGYLSYGIVCPG